MTQVLPLAASSIGRARMLTRDWARAEDPELLWRLELVVSELVTNAVRHGRGPITLNLTRRGEVVEISVHDQGSVMPKPHLPMKPDGSPGGRGFPIVDELSRGWGVIPENGRAEGKTVWARVAATD